MRIKWSLRKCLNSHVIRACNDVTITMPLGLFSRLDPSVPARPPDQGVAVLL